MPNIDFDREVVELTDDNASRLRKLNLGAGVLHLLTGLAMIVLGDLDFELLVSGFNISGPPGTPSQMVSSTSSSGFHWLSASRRSHCSRRSSTS